MVEHSAVNRVVVGSSPTRGGSPIGLDKLDSHAMSVKVDTHVRDVIGLARDERFCFAKCACSVQTGSPHFVGPPYLRLAT